MANENSVSDVFRFVQLRPRIATMETPTISLADSTPLARELADAPSVGRRAAAANAALKAAMVHDPGDTPLGRQILLALQNLAEYADASTDDLGKAVPDLAAFRASDEFNLGMVSLSDVLLASNFATENIPPELAALQDVFRVYNLPSGDEPPVSLARFLRRPLLAPSLPSVSPPERVRSGRAQVEALASDERAALGKAIDELVRLDRRELLEQPDEHGRPRGNATAFSLKAEGRSLLSRETRGLLGARGIDPSAATPDTIVARLLDEKAAIPITGIQWPKPVVTTQPGVTLPPTPGPALIGPAGVADLLVVKQQIKRYEAAEIAHIENVLAGEKKSRAHRQLERTEDTTLTETETTRSRETELETADRFELNRETAETIKNDQKVGFGLTLSGKYGPSIEFSSSLSVDSSTLQEQSAKSSSRFAKDVVKRSLERLTERVREVRTRTVIRETEETNLHELSNESDRHRSGIYQFVDKIYETQVFNYGIRQMFDFMIPEPASFLWYVQHHPTLDIQLPPPVKDLFQVCPDASALTEDVALALAAAYGADIDPPPAPYLLVTTAFKHGDDDAGESGQPHGTQQVDLTLPAGYRALRARFQGMALTDEDPVITLTIGSARGLWQPGAADRVGVSAGWEIARSPVLFLNLEGEPYALSAESKLPVLLVAYETNTYAFDVLVVATRTTDGLSGWRLATFKKLRAAYEDRSREYEQKVQQLQADAEAKAERENQLPLGAPPAMNKQTIAIELKKHCLSLLTQQWYDAFDATKDGTPPTFDLAEAMAEGAYVRFFEQAFEWDQAQWVFYPYFWARKSTWIERFVKQDVDPQFLEFLRAGSARVVVPARPGFEVALTHFLETGKLWGGEGEPPQINTPLYVSIIDEIRERTGAPQGEVPVGDPWEARVPTALIFVRSRDDLPRWKRSQPTGWEWQPDDGS